MSPQIENMNKERESIKRNHIEILELKSENNWNKNFSAKAQQQLWGGGRKNLWTGIWVNWDYPVWGAERKNKKENKRAIRNLCDNIKHTNICIMGVQKKEDRRKESKEYLKT